MTDTNLVTMLPNGQLPFEEVLRRLRPTVTQIPNTRLDFVVSHETWHWNPSFIEEGTVGEIFVQRSALTAEGEYDGCIWEFPLVWMMVGANGPWLRAKVFHESFAAFTEVTALFNLLAACETKNPPPEYVTGILLALGFNDRTERVNPHDEPRIAVCPTCERELDHDGRREFMNDDGHTYD